MHLKIPKTTEREGIRRVTFASSGSRLRSNRGVALLVVVTLVALTAITLIAFVTSASNRASFESVYEQNIRTETLPDTLINLVIAQIRDATSGINEAEERVTWASQPGVIRRYGIDGQFEKAFKLYSDESMIVRSEEALVAHDLNDLQSWTQNPNVWVDLNEPVIRGDLIHYPIVDPRSKSLSQIEGFEFDSESLPPGPMSGPLAKSGSETLPMPVKWIYQLADTNLGFLDAGNRFIPIGTDVTPTEQNPIVARFAFWTDDETSKLNINTAAGGEPWDIPRVGGRMDRHFAIDQPLKGEFQRYPGHPATTHLSPVLIPAVENIAERPDALKLIYDLVPKIQAGLSGGEDPESIPNFILSQEPLKSDQARLYPSVDELLLDENRSMNFLPELDRAAEWVERSRFFLTTRNHSPETTHFDTPRISMWPTYYRQSGEDDAYLTPIDQLMRKCAELGMESDDHGIPYHFQRANADHPTYDYENITRNKLLYSYLVEMMNEPVPGYGVSFAEKYGESETAQIATQMFDYIRATNLCDESLYKHREDRAVFPDNRSDHLTYTNPMRESNAPERGVWTHQGHGQVTPIRIDDTQGFGRHFTIAEVAVHVICNADGSYGSTWSVPSWAPMPVFPLRGGGYAAPRDNGFIDANGRPHQSPGIKFPGWDYSNLPPLDQATYEAATGERVRRSALPRWLRSLYERRSPLFEIATQPENWNWMLAYGHPAYDWKNNKFNQSALPANVAEEGFGRLRNGEKLCQAAFLIQLFSPSVGWVGINPDIQIEVEFEGMEFQATSGPGRQLPDGTWCSTDSGFGEAFTGRSYGGINDPRILMDGENPIERRTQNGTSYIPSSDGKIYDGSGRYTWLDQDWDENQAKPWNLYPWVTLPFKVQRNVRMMPGKVKIRLYSGGDADEDFKTQNSQTTGDVGRQLVQTFEIEFPGFSVPSPNIANGIGGHGPGYGEGYLKRTPGREYWSYSYDGVNPLTASHGRMAKPESNQGQQRVFFQHDIIQGIGISHGDIRLVAADHEITPDDEIFAPNFRYGERRIAHNMRSVSGGEIPHWGNFDDSGGSRNARNFVLVQELATPPYFNSNSGYDFRKMPYLASSIPSVEANLYGDFDNGQSDAIDGAYINKPDEGNLMPKLPGGRGLHMKDFHPYFAKEYYPPGNHFSSPSRMVPSPGMFGSLPTGVKSGKPWRTLLFRPDVAGNGFSSHIGAESPPDHLIMDLFWTPVVEPYAISETLSTAGKVNLNYQILPFRYIERSTAIRGVLKSETMLCVPNSWAYESKLSGGFGPGYHWLDNPQGGSLRDISLRSMIVPDKTLQQFEERFDRGEIFRSASEICDIHLIPEHVDQESGTGTDNPIRTYTPSLAEMKNGKYWKDHAMVGDNSRERPYTTIYPRVTTKSNTFQIHYKVELLRKAKGSAPEKWNPDLDSVAGMRRGSALIERYLDANDEHVPDYAETFSEAVPLSDFYHYRVLLKSDFAP